MGISFSSLILQCPLFINLVSWLWTQRTWHSLKWNRNVARANLHEPPVPGSCRHYHVRKSTCFLLIQQNQKAGSLGVGQQALGVICVLDLYKSLCFHLIFLPQEAYSYIGKGGHFTWFQWSCKFSWKQLIAFGICLVRKHSRVLFLCPTQSIVSFDDMENRWSWTFWLAATRGSLAPVVIFASGSSPSSNAVLIAWVNCSWSTHSLILSFLTCDKSWGLTGKSKDCSLLAYTALLIQVENLNPCPGIQGTQIHNPFACAQNPHCSLYLYS